MKVVHVTDAMHQANGVSLFVRELSTQLLSNGLDVRLAVGFVEPNYPIPCGLKIISLDLCRSEGLDVDIVHIHGLWTYEFTRIARLARRNGAKIVWSPHGMLTPWALKNHWPKKLAGLLAYQYWALRSADLIHVTADSEVADVRRLHLKNKLVLAPLGVHLPTLNSELRTLNYLCFVSRIQRKKGLPNLLRAWAQLSATLKRGWQIKIAGPDEDNHLAELYTLCEELKIPYSPAPVDATSSSRPQKDQTSTVDLLSRPTFLDLPPEILFLGPVYDSAKDALYANAAFSVLPTHSENFGSVVIESLAQGTPVICTKGAPWRDLVDYNCGWWIDIGVAPLVSTLTQLLKTSTSQLRLMGARGRALVERKYTWSGVAHKIEDAYANILE